MHDISAGIKQQIEAAKAEAIKTAKQAPRWPESAPLVPSSMEQAGLAIRRCRLSSDEPRFRSSCARKKTNGEPPLGPRR
jgi:hypothetical protein